MYEINAHLEPVSHLAGFQWQCDMRYVHILGLFFC